MVYSLDYWKGSLKWEDRCELSYAYMGMDMQGSWMTRPCDTNWLSSHVFVYPFPCCSWVVERTTNPCCKTLKEVIAGIGCGWWVHLQVLQLAREREGSSAPLALGTWSDGGQSASCYNLTLDNSRLCLRKKCYQDKDVEDILWMEKTFSFISMSLFCEHKGYQTLTEKQNINCLSPYESLTWYLIPPAFWFSVGMFQ